MRGPENGEKPKWKKEGSEVWPLKPHSPVLMFESREKGRRSHALPWPLRAPSAARCKPALEPGGSPASLGSLYPPSPVQYRGGGDASRAVPRVGKGHCGGDSWVALREPSFCTKKKLCSVWGRWEEKASAARGPCLYPQIEVKSGLLEPEQENSPSST